MRTHAPRSARSEEWLPDDAGVFSILRLFGVEGAAAADERETDDLPRLLVHEGFRSTCSP